ncbi:HAD family hydrolase [Promicromonospora sp. NPDC052451]|uniref:HAD family hydrolase n=1 Tax=Promicromonospora sp. NPDC052451 TaxID=3364407 RepID=UPI0037CAC084
MGTERDTRTVPAPGRDDVRVLPHLVALDVDGTLVGPDDRIPAETVAALELVRASGHHVVLATGRSLVGMLSVARRLGLARGWAVCSNGALTVRLDPATPSGYDVVEVRTFATGPVIGRAVALAPDVFVAVEEVGRGWRVNRRFAPGALNGPQSLSPGSQLRVEHGARVVLHADRIADHVTHLREAGVTVTPAGADWVDVTAHGTDKAFGLGRVRDALGVAAERTVAVGDGVNDLPMLVWAARGVAMGHAPGSLHAVADEIAGTVEEQGVVPVLHSLVPAAARRPGLSPLAAQLAAAVRTVAGDVPPGSGPDPAVVVRVWHGASPDLAGCEVHAHPADGPVRRVPVPAGRASTMRDVERAAREAGLTYPRGDTGRRRAYWRGVLPGGAAGGPAAFELPLTPC